MTELKVGNVYFCDKDRYTYFIIIGQETVGEYDIWYIAAKCCTPEHNIAIDAMPFFEEPLRKSIVIDTKMSFYEEPSSERFFNVVNQSLEKMRDYFNKLGGHRIFSKTVPDVMKMMTAAYGNNKIYSPCVFPTSREDQAIIDSVE